MVNRNKKGQFVKGSNIKDISGKRFGKLTVLGLDKCENRRSYWFVKCDCGNVKSVRSDTLTKICSCGCVKKKQDNINLHITNPHNLTYHPAYRIWQAMLNRCYSEINEHYKDYGKRGITVCEEWKDVRNFCKWADKTNFKNNLTIERIDVNGNYCPENCKWIPMKEQAWNRRDTIYVLINGEKVPLARTARENGIEPKLAYGRFKRGICDFERLFFKGHLQKDLYYRS